VIQHRNNANTLHLKMNTISRAIASSRRHLLVAAGYQDHTSRCALLRPAGVRRRSNDCRNASFVGDAVGGTSTSSSSTSVALAWGAVIASAPLLGWNENMNLGYNFDNVNVYCRSRHSIRSITSTSDRFPARFCQCETNNSKSSFRKGGVSDNGNDSGGFNDVHDSKSTQDCLTKTATTFFDMAQQWASDYSRETSNDGKKSSTIEASNCRQKIQPTTSSNFQTAEAALLSAMGITGWDANRSEYSQNVGDQKNESDEMNAQPDETNVLQRMLVGFDEFKHYLPNMSSTMVNHERSDNEVDDQSKSNIFAEFLSLAKNVSVFATAKSSNSSSISPSIEELIQQAQRIVTNHVSTSSSQQQSDSSGFLPQEILYFQQNAVAIQRAFESAFGNTQYFADINAVKDIFRSVNWFAALHYFLEYEDSIKTPSWKRRMHRYQRDVEVAKVEELNEALILSELSYADSVDDIRTGLEKLYHGEKATEDERQKVRNKPQWELLFCDLESRPNQPSHFLAIQKNASPYDDILHVLMVVRGTKTMSDLITDAMMEAADYEYVHPGSYDDANNPNILCGKAHGGMQESGKYLVDRHQKLLSTLLQLSKKRKLEITLVGHSLGAGAATIAAMEWNSKQFLFEQGNKVTNDITQISKIAGRSINDVQVSAHVIGFGCPALLSQPLSQATKGFVTTVIADADFIPRMSGATLVNLLLDVKDFDYQKQAERDVEQALREVKNRFSIPSFRSKLSFDMSEDDIQSVMGYVRRGLEKVTPMVPAPNVAEPTTVGVDRHYSKTAPILYPPGECIHFYRDGSGISGTYVNCDFFNEVWSFLYSSSIVFIGYIAIIYTLLTFHYHAGYHFRLMFLGRWWMII
jgi:hypothetical protein